MKKVKVRDPRYSTDELKILIIQEEKDTVVGIPGVRFFDTVYRFIFETVQQSQRTMFGDWFWKSITVPKEFIKMIYQKREHSIVIRFDESQTTVWYTEKYP